MCSEDDNQNGSSIDFARHLAKLQEEYLIPLKEDLADWINKVLDYGHIDAHNFMSRLDNGVIVCKLAKVIEEKCLIPDRIDEDIGSACVGNNNNGESASPTSLNHNHQINNHLTTHRNHAHSHLSRRNSTNSTTSSSSCSSTSSSSSSYCHSISALRMKCWENAKSESFYARDNVSNFIQWCRKLNVREAVLFETEDLVLHNNPRSVVLCLLEVARIACRKYLFTPVPGLVEFEKEIDAEEREEMEREARRRKHYSLLKSKINKENEINKGTSLNGTLTVTDSNGNSLNGGSSSPPNGERIFSPSSSTSSLTIAEDDVSGWSSVSQNLERASSVASISTTSVASTETSLNQEQSAKKVSQLDRKVMLIAKSYYGKKARHGVQRLAEGKYRIAGKIVFVRLLKDRHVMVRVGGGWDTLQHFLERHGEGSDSLKDISPSDLLPMDTRPSESMSRRKKSSQPSVSIVNSVPSTPVLRRCLSSTPISRSSLSSPEPTNNSSFGSDGDGPPATITTPAPSKPASKLPVFSMRRQLSHGPATAGTADKGSSSPSVSLMSAFPRRRSLVLGSEKPSLSPRPSLIPNCSRINRSSLNLYLTRSYSNTAPNSPVSSLANGISISNDTNGRLKNRTLTNTTSTPGVKATSTRFPNYLQSSQHITKKPLRSPTISNHNSQTTTSASSTINGTSSNKGPSIPRASLKAF